MFMNNRNSNDKSRLNYNEIKINRWARISKK